MYSGMYNGSKKHEPDLEKVLERAWNVGVQRIIVTAGNLKDVQQSLALVKGNGNQFDDQMSNVNSTKFMILIELIFFLEKLFTTVGVHPTRCSEFVENPEQYLSLLRAEYEAEKEKIVALGEFGLDYERTQFCDVETQKK